VHSTSHSQQPPERLATSHAKYSSQIVGLEVVQNCLQQCNPMTSSSSLSIFWWGCNYAPEF